MSNEKTLTIRVNLSIGTGLKTLELNNADVDVYKVNFESMFNNNMCVFYGKYGEAIAFNGKDVNWIEIADESGDVF